MFVAVLSEGNNSELVAQALKERPWWRVVRADYTSVRWRRPFEARVRTQTAHRALLGVPRSARGPGHQIQGFRVSDSEQLEAE